MAARGGAGMGSPSPLMVATFNRETKNRTGYLVKWKSQINSKSFLRVSTEKPGHTYTEKLSIVELKLRCNRFLVGRTGVGGAGQAYIQSPP